MSGRQGFRPDGGRRGILQSPAWLAVLFVIAAGAFPAMARPVHIVVLGDSLSAGFLLPADAAFPAVLQRRLREEGADVVIENAGVSGDTAADGLARVDWSVPDGTDFVIVELGANDMLRGIDSDQTRATLDAICKRIAARGIGLVIAGMRSIGNWGSGYGMRFEAIYPSLAREHSAPLYPFFMDGVFNRPDLLLPDRLHPNARGVEAMVAGFLPFIESVVDSYARKAHRAG
jgi:acyl-CoA thioesterase-1